jgi:hypothetical protein
MDMHDRVIDASVTRATDPAPPPHPELERLDRLVGTWRVEGYTRDSLAGPAGPVRSTETFEWLDGGYFLVHRYETVFSDEAPQRGVMFWGYDAAGSRFRCHFFSNNGPFTEDGNIYDGRIIGRQMIFTGPARFTLLLDEDGKIQVRDGTFHAAWELRDADGIWRPWMCDTYSRVK